MFTRARVAQAFAHSTGMSASWLSPAGVVRQSRSTVSRRDAARPPSNGGCRSQQEYPPTPVERSRVQSWSVRPWSVRHVLHSGSCSAAPSSPRLRSTHHHTRAGRNNHHTPSQRAAGCIALPVPSLSACSPVPTSDARAWLRLGSAACGDTANGPCVRLHIWRPRIVYVRERAVSSPCRLFAPRATLHRTYLNRELPPVRRGKAGA